ncbi:MAG: RsmE family RNA methyltransferase [Caldilineaceae bacterium]
MLDDRHGTGTVLAAQDDADSEPAAPHPLPVQPLKADKFEWVLQKAPNWAGRFVPVVSVRSVVRPVAALAKKADRWQAIIREAAEQAGRARLPTLHPPLPFDAAVRHATGLRLLAVGRSRRSLPGLGELVGRTTGPLALLVGPEGGIAPRGGRPGRRRLAAGHAGAARSPRRDGRAGRRHHRAGPAG